MSKILELAEPEFLIRVDDTFYNPEPLTWKPKITYLAFPEYLQMIHQGYYRFEFTGSPYFNKIALGKGAIR